MNLFVSYTFPRWKSGPLVATDLCTQALPSMSCSPDTQFLQPAKVLVRQRLAWNPPCTLGCTHSWNYFHHHKTTPLHFPAVEGQGTEWLQIHTNIYITFKKKSFRTSIVTWPISNSLPFEETMRHERHFNQYPLRVACPKVLLYWVNVYCFHYLSLATQARKGQSMWWQTIVTCPTDDVNNINLWLVLSMIHYLQTQS